MAKEIKDVRRVSKIVSGDTRKYNKDIKQMLDYAKKSKKLPPKNRKGVLIMIYTASYEWIDNLVFD